MPESIKSLLPPFMAVIKSYLTMDFSLWLHINIPVSSCGTKVKTFAKLTVEHVNRHRDFREIANCTCVVAGIVSVRIRYI